MNLFDVQLYSYKGEVFVDSQGFAQLCGRSIRNVYNYVRGSVGPRRMVSYKLPSGNLMIPVRELWEYPISGRGRTFALIASIMDVDENGNLNSRPLAFQTYSETNVARRNAVLAKALELAVEISVYIGDAEVTARNENLENKRREKFEIPAIQYAGPPKVHPVVASSGYIPDPAPAPSTGILRFQELAAKSDDPLDDDPLDDDPLDDVLESLADDDEIL